MIIKQFFILLLLISSVSVLAQDESVEIIEGQKLFRIHCGRCHGMLGAGGTGPSLRRPYLPRASTDEKLAYVIANGIEGTGMP
jgi:mono/diheme cytochrome c family protein